MRVRRGLAIAFWLFLPLWILGVANMYRPSVYLEHRYWFTFESKHFIFHYAPDYSHRNEITSYAAIRDTAFERNCDYLGVTIEDKIDFYVYDDLAGGHAEGWESMIFADHDQSIGHEMTHVIAYHIAGKRQKIKLLDEGIATWLNHAKVEGGYHGFSQKYYIRKYGLPPLSELSHTKTFRRHTPPSYYPSASFVGYLIENYGMEKFRRLWTENADYPEVYDLLEQLGFVRFFPFISGQRTHFETTVREIYNLPLDQLDREWRDWLEE